MGKKNEILELSFEFALQVIEEKQKGVLILK